MSNPRQDLERTTCACAGCQMCCRHMPGALIQGDLELIAEHTGNGVHEGNQVALSLDWLLEHFEASEGARIIVGAHGPDPQAVSIPSLVPRLTEKGCIFLTEDGHCSIHEVAPFGCAYHDTHMTKEEGDPRSQAAVESQYSAWKNGDSYGTYWTVLHKHGKIASPLRERRDNLSKAWEELDGG